MRKKLIISILLCCSGFIVKAQNRHQKAPEFVLGTFADDYGLNYVINDTLWIQNQTTRYHIIKWNPKKQYLIAKNDSANPSDKNKYTRIDYMVFKGMEPWQWGFCLTAYKADTDVQAEQTAAADRKNPKKGCNGYPFSRMKRIKHKP